MTELGQWQKDELSKLKKNPKLYAFALRQCAKNRERMAREAQGYHGPCIHIVCEKTPDCVSAKELGFGR